MISIGHAVEFDGRMWEVTELCEEPNTGLAVLTPQPAFLSESLYAIPKARTVPIALLELLEAWKRSDELHADRAAKYSARISILEAAHCEHMNVIGVAASEGQAGPTRVCGKVAELNDRIAVLKAELKELEAQLKARESVVQNIHHGPCDIGLECPYFEIDRLKSHAESVLAALAEERKSREIFESSAADAIVERNELKVSLTKAMDELEKERMRLAACGVAALGNTEFEREKRLQKDNPYYSASYQAVSDAVDREMAARAENDRVMTALLWVAGEEGRDVGMAYANELHDHATLRSEMDQSEFNCKKERLDEEYAELMARHKARLAALRDKQTDAGRVERARKELLELLFQFQSEIQKPEHDEEWVRNFAAMKVRAVLAAADGREP